MNLKFLIATTISIVYATNTISNDINCENNDNENSFLSTSVLASNSNVLLGLEVAKEDGVVELNNLTLDLLIKIGEYLTCPQKSLGFMNKHLSQVFFHERPYRFFLAQRLNFPPFLDSNSDAGLIHFEKLAFLKNPILRYFAIINLFKNHDNIFRENSKIVTAYAGTLHHYFTPPAPIVTPENAQENDDDNNSNSDDSSTDSDDSDDTSDSSSFNEPSSSSGSSDSEQSLNSNDSSGSSSGSDDSFNSSALSNQSTNLSMTLQIYPLFIKKVSNDYFKVLKDLQSHDAILAHMALFPRICHKIEIFTSEDIKFGKILMEKIVNIKIDPPFILEHLQRNNLPFKFDDVGYRFYFGILNLFFTEGSGHNIGYIITSIACNIPIEWYLNEIVSLETDLRDMFFRDLFGQAKIFESPEDTLRIYDTVTQILNSITFADPLDFQFYSLLNSIRFGDFNDFEECFGICTELSLNQSRLLTIVKASALAKKHHFVIGIYNANVHQVEPLEHLKMFLSGNRSAHVLISLLENATILDSQILAFDVFAKSYNLIDFDYADSIFKFDFKLKVDDESEGLPQTYQYRVPHKFGYNSDSDKFILEYIRPLIRLHLFASSEHEESSLISIFSKLKRFSAFHMLNPEFPFEASCKVMSIISQSEALLKFIRIFGVTFKISLDKRNLNNLFDKSVQNLKGILTDLPASVLEHLISERQFRNFEKFVGKKIPSIFLKVISKISARDLRNRINSYRHALHYWLNGPQQNRLKELWSSHPYLLENLMVEVDSDDQDFLLNIS